MSEEFEDYFGEPHVEVKDVLDHINRIKEEIRGMDDLSVQFKQGALWAIEDMILEKDKSESEVES